MKNIINYTKNAKLFTESNIRQEIHCLESIENPKIKFIFHLYFKFAHRCFCINESAYSMENISLIPERYYISFWYEYWKIIDYRQ